MSESWWQVCGTFKTITYNKVNIDLSVANRLSRNTRAYSVD